MLDGRETVETRGLTDRELILAAYHKMNGVAEKVGDLTETVAGHHLEMYGDTKLSVVGLKPQTIQNTVALKTIRVVFATLAGVVSIIGIGNLIVMITLASRIAASNP